MAATSPAGSLCWAARTGDPRRQRCHRLVADVLVDQLGGRARACRRRRRSRGRARPARVASASPETRWSEERDRIDGAGEPIGSGASRLEVAASAFPAAPWQYMPTGSPLASASAETSSCARGAVSAPDGSWRSTRDGAEIRQLLRLLDELLGTRRCTGAVDEAGIELPTGGRDRLAGLAQVRDVVQRVVQTEDLDAVLGRAGARSGGTKSPATGREPTRKRPRSARPSGVFVRELSARIRSHGLSTPRRTALSNTPTARDLERSEPRAVEDLGELEQLGRSESARPAAPG